MPITFKVASHDANEYNRYGEQGEITVAGVLKEVYQSDEFQVKGV
jgi:hypothetical protein